VQAGLALPRGGMGALAAAMTKAAEAAGTAFRYGARVANITVTDDAASGVVLEGGEAITAGTIVSAINPKTTLLDLVGPRHLDTGLF
jgi:phytoene dehydrogenase-like protein